MSIPDLVTDGPLIAAAGVSALAGLVSFLSPCVLPLVPGYVSYVTGIAGADLDAALGSDPSGRAVQRRVTAAEVVGSDDAENAGGVAVATRDEPPSRARVRGRVLAGSVLFVAGFSAVFTLLAFATGGIGGFLLEHEATLQRVVGALVIVFGLGYLGVLPGLQREARVRWLPASGLAGAPLLGAVFGLGWIPCVGPTLGAVLGLAAVQGGAGRGALLALAYCAGLGVPFVLFGLGFRRLLGGFAAVRRNSRWVVRIGGVLLVVVGAALLLGFWDDLVIWVRSVFGVGGVPL
ncbi:cytochrome c biogenesis CcdA family protein [Cryptosporangium aurantiacum]|uniref:Cytochrome c-type biogenesis protein n=1 Tax=Cryptosporangium aurantiacum TaxID=134849 RepID=A0A1M7RH19_9ACTN|nr:cytochrome c biogenesis protein CcdA [Cryptosporangium aurantiacum]SHN45605.1 cytochrome c-type biogenesis protein [Cryptosporangium aurantiacum]